MAVFRRGNVFRPVGIGTSFAEIARVKLPFVSFIKARHVSHAALSAGVLLAAIVFFVVGAGVRLLIGPVSLGPLHGALAAAIHDALPGIALEYDQAAIEWSRDEGRVNLVILGTRVYDGHGHVVARAPKADIDLAAAPLLSGNVVVRRIALVGVQLTLVRMKDGSIRLGPEKDRDSADIIHRLQAVIERGSGKSALESFAVRNSRLMFRDEITGLAMMAPDTKLAIGSRGAAVTLDLDGDMEISGRRSHITGHLLIPPGTAPITGDIALNKLDLRTLSTNAPLFAFLANVPLSTSASARFTLSADGVLRNADFDLTASGNIPVQAMATKALHVTSFRLRGHYEGDGRHLTLKTVQMNAREGHVSGHGQADLIYADGALKDVRGQIELDRIAIDAPGLFPQPVRYQMAAVAGDYQLDARRLTISRLVLGAPGFALKASGALTSNDKGSPGLSVQAHIDALPVRTLLRYWPLPLIHGARAWVDENIFAGTVGPLDAKADFAPGVLDQPALPEDSVQATFAMRGIEGSYIKGLTHVTGVNGQAVLTGDTFRASFTGGKIGPITVTNGTALIPTLHKKGTVGQFGAHVDGTMPDIMHLIDMKPLNYPSKFGIDPAQTHGTASADLMFNVPMLADLPVDGVGIDVNAKVDGFGVTLGRLKVHDGQVTFDINNDRLHQTGVVGLADSRLNVDWTEDFKTKNKITTHLSVQGDLSDGARAALGIHLERYMRGRVPITADITGHRGALIRADVTADFTPVLLMTPIVNLEKAVGKEASGQVVVNFGPGNVLRDETIHVSGPNLNATGTAVFGQDGDMTSMVFPTIRMGPDNDLAFQFQHGAQGGVYTIRGRSLDGSHLVGDGKKPGSAAKEQGQDEGAGPPEDNMPKGPFRISVQLQQLVLRDGVAIAPFNMDLTGVGDRPATLSLNGTLVRGKGSAPISANIATVSKDRHLTLTAGNAGLLVRGLFSFESMRGGALNMSAVLPGRAVDETAPDAKTPDFSGELSVTNFRMVNQSFLTRLFSAGSLTGLVDLMGGEGMSLDSLDVPFSSRNNVISIKGARVAGSAVGASADGYIDRPQGKIALKGSLVPAFGLNSFISNVPLLGDILASRKGEGIFGVTYSLTGDAAHPDISTNPLSILTPGILRRIFEGHIPTAANAPTNVHMQSQEAEEKEKAQEAAGGGANSDKPRAAPAPP